MAEEQQVQSAAGDVAANEEGAGETQEQGQGWGESLAAAHVSGSPHCFLRHFTSKCHHAADYISSYSWIFHGFVIKAVYLLIYQRVELGASRNTDQEQHSSTQRFQHV